MTKAGAAQVLGLQSPAQVQAALVALLETDAPARALALYESAAAAGIALPFPGALIRALHRAGQTQAARRLALEARFPTAPAHWQWLTRAQALEGIGAADLAFALLAEGVAANPKAPNLLGAQARLAFLSAQPPEITAALCRAAIAARADLSPLLARIERLVETGTTEAMGFTLHLPAEAVSPRVALGILNGSYEATERQAATRGLSAADRVLELGAGIGLVALSIARAVPGVRLLTVEANPELEAPIRANFAANGCDATLIGAVAALADGETEFHLARDFWASSTQALPEETRTIRRATVDVNRLIAEFRPSVLVMDIEGGEVALLPHIELGGLRRLVIEFHPALCLPAEISACVARLLGAGFVLDLGAGSQQVLVFDRPPASTETA